MTSNAMSNGSLDRADASITRADVFSDQKLEARLREIEQNARDAVHVATNVERATGAPGILIEATATITERGVQRDAAASGERSMAKTVAAFNGLTGRDLTEKEGWFFMTVLKMARSMNGKSPRRDDFVDGAAYFALAGESVLPTPTPAPYATETPSSP